MCFSFNVTTKQKDTWRWQQILLFHAINSFATTVNNVEPSCVQSKYSKRNNNRIQWFTDILFVCFFKRLNDLHILLLVLLFHYLFYLFYLWLLLFISNLLLILLLLYYFITLLFATFFKKKQLPGFFFKTSHLLLQSCFSTPTVY